MNQLISVIMPVYNVESYVVRSINSVLNQTYKNLELIIVDDGSTDRSGTICDQFMEKDGRVRVIHQENGGLSHARNTGLAMAIGDYVSFIDSDDFYEIHFIEYLYQSCVENDCEIGICDYVETTQDSISEVEYNDNLHFYNRLELLLHMYEEYDKKNTTFVVTWNKLYKRNLFEHICFPKGRIHEDEATTYKIYDLVKKGVYVELPMYGYNQNGMSITRDYFKSTRLDFITALEERMLFFAEKGEFDLAIAACKACGDGAIRFNRKLKMETPDSIQYQNRCKMTVRNMLKSSKSMGGMSFRTRMGYRLFLWNESLYYFLLRDIIK